MVMLKKNDFVEIEYTARVREDNTVFDTTDEKIAKDNDLYEASSEYGPIVVCIGQHQLLEGLDKELEGKETGKSYKIELKPENAFGKKNSKLLKILSSTAFRKQNVQPVPGLQVNMDGILGTIRSVTGGRLVIDFNHPLAGKDILYEIKLNRIVTDDKEKLKKYLELQLNEKNVDVEITNSEAKATLSKEPSSAVKEKLEKKAAELIPSVKKLVFEARKAVKENVTSPKK